MQAAQSKSMEGYKTAELNEQAEKAAELYFAIQSTGVLARLYCLAMMWSVN